MQHKPSILLTRRWRSTSVPVGKGYAVEQTARAAQARGLTSALLNIGGNVRAIGTKPGGKPWTAGVENPGAMTPRTYRPSSWPTATA